VSQSAIFRRLKSRLGKTFKSLFTVNQCKQQAKFGVKPANGTETRKGTFFEN